MSPDEVTGEAAEETTVSEPVAAANESPQGLTEAESETSEAGPQTPDKAPDLPPLEAPKYPDCNLTVVGFSVSEVVGDIARAMKYHGASPEDIQKFRASASGANSKADVIQAAREFVQILD